MSVSTPLLNAVMFCPLRKFSSVKRELLINNSGASREMTTSNWEMATANISEYLQCVTEGEMAPTVIMGDFTYRQSY